MPRFRFHFQKGLLLFLLSAFFFNTCYADRIVIKGKPVELILHRYYYKFPLQFTYPNEGFHFVNLLDVPRVCYLQLRKQLVGLDMVAILIEDGDNKLKRRWYCYKYDPRYFEIDY